MRATGGWAAAVSDEAIVAAIRLLAETSGVFTETAGGATLGAALELARQGRFRDDDEVVLCITGNGLKTTDVLSDVLAWVADHRREGAERWRAVRRRLMG
jgi:threonine synthase